MIEVIVKTIKTIFTKLYNSDITKVGGAGIITVELPQEEQCIKWIFVALLCSNRELRHGPSPNPGRLDCLLYAIN